MKIQKRVKVELLRKRAARPIEAVQYDTGNQVIFEIVDFDLPTGTKATLYIQKPSGKFVYQEDEITVVGNNITVNLHNQALTEHGKIYYQVRIENGADLISTFTGLMLIDKSLADAGATESRTVLSAFAELTAEKIAEIHAAAAEEIAKIRAVANEKADALTLEASGNPVQIYPDEGSLLKPVLTFNPIQSGSGDPYPAGGGEQLLPLAFAGNTASASGITVTFDDLGCLINGTPTTDYVLPFGVAEISLTPGTYYVSGGESPKAYMQIKIEREGENLFFHNDSFEVRGDEIAIKYMLQIGTAANVGTLTNYRVKPMLVKGTKAPTEYKSYANIRPISGRTGAELVRCGKNLFSLDEYTTNATGETLTSRITPIPFIAGHKYKIYGTTSDGITLNSSNTQIVCRDKNGNNIWLPSPNINNLFTVPDNIVDAEYYCVFTTSELAGKTIRLMVEQNTTATEYEPYQGETFTLDFGQTVYGGTLDLGKGELVVDKVKVVLDGSEPFTYHDVANTGHIFRYTPTPTPFDTLTESKLICDRYAPAAFHARKEKSAYISIAGCVDFIDSDYDETTWPAYLAEQHAAGTPLHICYELANPITIQLDPAQIEALAGVNTVYTDADSMVVNYNKSLNKAFEEALARIAALEAAAVNNV